MKTDIVDSLTSTIVALLIALPIIVDEVNKELNKIKKIRGIIKHEQFYSKR